VVLDLRRKGRGKARGDDLRRCEAAHRGDALDHAPAPGGGNRAARQRVE
jgi:hypothetical protein